jgi:two-component system, LytTR family, sensor histidine kinase AlgZ
MHPILAQGSRLALYLVFWLFVGVILAAPLGTSASLPRQTSLLMALPLAAMYGLLCLSAWYVARSMPLGGTGVIRIAATAVTAATCSSSAWLLLAALWTRALQWTGVVDAGASGGAAVRALLFGFGFLLYLLSLAIGYLLVIFEQSRETERRGFEVKVQAREAELRSLRAQIDPHFLFNSLHSISALTTIDPGAARRMCVLLAQFLRESVALGAEAQITLAQELRLVEQYLAVELVRFGDRLTVAIDNGGEQAALVPPLLLQPIVENAVTHGIAHTVDGGTLRITVVPSASTVRVVVENPCDPDRPKRTGTGVGLANVRSRLRALHGSDSWVTTSESGGVWRTEIALPLVRSERGATLTAAAGR